MRQKGREALERALRQCGVESGHVGVSVFVLCLGNKFCFEKLPNVPIAATCSTSRG